MNLSVGHVLIIALFLLAISLWMQDYFLDTEMLEIFLTVCLTLPHVVMLVFLLTNILRRCHSLETATRTLATFTWESSVSNAIICINNFKQLPLFPYFNCDVLQQK